MLYVGIDWASDHHDVCLTNDSAQTSAARETRTKPSRLGLVSLKHAPRASFVQCFHGRSLW